MRTIFKWDFCVLLCSRSNNGVILSHRDSPGVHTYGPSWWTGEETLKATVLLAAWLEKPWRHILHCYRNHWESPWWLSSLFGFNIIVSFKEGVGDGSKVTAFHQKDTSLQILLMWMEAPPPPSNQSSNKEAMASVFSSTWPTGVASTERPRSVQIKNVVVSGVWDSRLQNAALPRLDWLSVVGGAKSQRHRLVWWLIVGWYKCTVSDI